MRHRSNVVNAMAVVGHTIADLRPAYPGQSEAYIDQLFADNSLSLDRPVLPYGLLGIAPCQSRYFNVTDGGFRSSGSLQPWPPAPDRTNIFVFGGSTTLGFSVEDCQTIPATLQARLNSAGLRCEVYNFGAGGYRARHEALRFLDLLDRKFVPDYALFLDGMNDCYEALGNRYLVDTLNELYSAAKRRRRGSYWTAVIDFATSAYRERRFDRPVARFTMEYDEEQAAECLSEPSIMRALGSSQRRLSTEDMTPFQLQVAESAWGHYRDSVSLSRVLAARHDVKTVFFWQPGPYYATRPSQRVADRLHVVYRYAALSYPIYNWVQATRFAGMSNAQDFVDLSHLGESIDDVLYSDVMHYSPAFCAHIAGAMADCILARITGSAASATAVAAGEAWR